MTGLDDISGRLFDYAANEPEGFTHVDACLKLDISKGVFDKAVRQLRLILGNDDSINLVADKAGRRERWIYRLVGTQAEAMWWQGNRSRDSESRLRTILAVCGSMVAATDGRTVDGKRARMMFKALSRLVEDLDELNAEV